MADVKCISAQEVTQALLSVDAVLLKGIFARSGMPATAFAEEFLVPVLDSIGARWQSGELSLAQVYMSGRICENLLAEDSISHPVQLKNHGIAVAVLEDFHVLGKRILCSVLRSAGYSFIDYGPVSLKALVEKIQKDSIKIIMVSTLMLSSALRVKLLREQLSAQGHDLKIIVGGAPFRFDLHLWQEVGADATSPTATGVIPLLNKLIEEATHANP